jgi:hypothetical protein
MRARHALLLRFAASYIVASGGGRVWIDIGRASVVYWIIRVVDSEGEGAWTWVEQIALNFQVT